VKMQFGQRELDPRFIGLRQVTDMAILRENPALNFSMSPAVLRALWLSSVNVRSRSSLERTEQQSKLLPSDEISVASDGAPAPRPTAGA
jgi:hypothetical protein